MKHLSVAAAFFFAITTAALADVKHDLRMLFSKAEQCYLIDDYQQLETTANSYADLLLSNSQALADSADVFYAYYYKMCGAYYYGLADNTLYANFSESFYRKSLAVFDNRVGTHGPRGMHPNSVTLHRELAQLYYATSRYNDALKQLDTLQTYYADKMWDDEELYSPDYYATVSELSMCNARLGHYDKALRQIDEAIAKFFKKKKDSSYYEAVRRKAKILMMQADSLATTDYSTAEKCYRQYVDERTKAISSEMATMTQSQRAQYWLQIHRFIYDCFRLGNRASEMLYDLTLFAKDYLLRKDSAPVKWKQVKASLGKNDCAIEFVQYFGRHDNKRLGCLVVRKDSKKPLFIDICSTDSLLNLPLYTWQTNEKYYLPDGSDYTVGSAITAKTGEVKNALYTHTKLPEIIWSSSLMRAIGNADRVFFAPDGMLHQLAIEYLMPDTTKQCVRLSSTRVLTDHRQPPTLSKAIIAGGIQYSTAYRPKENGNDAVAYRFLAPNASNISYLKGTKAEADSIMLIRANPEDVLLEGSYATDERFAALLPEGYSLIHLATHGYYGGSISIYNDIKPLLSDESMSKSGIIFAGAAATLNDPLFDDTMSDGVLSATEIAKLDLSATELVVLSACQTGMGRITDDGIEGLQRALKQAGAHAMILSLWNVDDLSGSTLMRFFYEELEKQGSQKNISEAFLTARQRLSHEQRTVYWIDDATFFIKEETIHYSTPQHSCPFILIDAF